MSHVRDHTTAGAVIKPTLRGPVLTGVSESVDPANEAQQRVRLLSAYTDSLEKLLQEDGNKACQKSKELTLYKTTKYSAEDSIDREGCRSYMNRCMRKMDDSLVPYKLLYVFIRGGEACSEIYLSVYGLQVGFNPLQLAFIFALPLLISFLTTPLCGYIADKFRCRKEILLFALCLWVFFSLSTNFIPAPELASCTLARKQLQGTIAKVNLTRIETADPALPYAIPSHQAVAGLVRNFKKSDATCLIPDNVTSAVEDTPSWLNVLRIIHTPWSEEMERCYPRSRFWGSARVPGGLSVEGPSTTFQGWVFGQESLTSTFFAVFALIAVAKVMQGTTLSLTDTATLHTLGPSRSHEYGWQRAFGNAGFAMYTILVTSFISLSLTQWSQCGVMIYVEDYRIAFVVFLGTTSCAIALLFAYCITFTHDYPHESNFFDLKKVFGQPTSAILLPVLCYLAANEGAVTVFLPFHLSTLGSTNLMMKGARIISGVSELLLAFHLGQLIKSRGHGFLLVSGALGYLLCFLAYALITTPVGILPVEVAHGMSRALTWNVIVARLSVEVLPENLASIQGCLMGFYYLGEGLGAVVAGVGVSSYGAPITFFCFAFACLVASVLLGLGFTKHDTKPKSDIAIRYQPLPGSDEE